MLMAIETFTASAALPSMYFLLLPQKKVPKKRGATSKRLPYAARPLAPKRNASGLALQAAAARTGPGSRHAEVASPAARILVPFEILPS